MKMFSRVMAAVLLAAVAGAVGVGAQGVPSYYSTAKVSADTPYKLGMFEQDARTFMGPGTRTFAGIVIRDLLVVDVSRIDGVPKTVREMLAAWTPALAAVLQKAANDARLTPPSASYPLEQITVLSPIADPANPALASVGLMFPAAPKAPAAAPAPARR